MSFLRQIAVYRTLGGNAALGPRIYEGAVTAVGGDWGSPNILPPASFHSATPLASAGGKGCGAHFKHIAKLKSEILEVTLCVAAIFVQKRGKSWPVSG